MIIILIKYSLRGPNNSLAVLLNPILFFAKQRLGQLPKISKYVEIFNLVFRYLALFATIIFYSFNFGRRAFQAFEVAYYPLIRPVLSLYFH
jgi:hypothetical protein